MTKEILIILSCVPLYVVNSFCDKIVSSRNQNKYNFIYNSLKFLICSICILPILFIEGASLLVTGSLFCGIMCGIMYAVSKTVILKGYEKTSVAFMTLCHSSGMIIPCIIGHFFWSERLSAISVIGMLLAIVSIVLLKDSRSTKNRFDTLGIIFGVIIFLTSAGVMITQKFMGIYFPKESVGAYTFCSFTVPFLMLLACAKIKGSARCEKKDRKLVAVCAAGSAISLSVISFVMTNLSGAVPSVILFPLFNGLGIIFVCIGSVFAFGEKLTPRKLAGLVLGVLGLCLVNF